MNNIFINIFSRRYLIIFFVVIFVLFLLAFDLNAETIGPYNLGYLQCGRHGLDKFCPNQIDWFPIPDRNDYTHGEIFVDFQGHRHGGGSDIEATACLLSSGIGPCITMKCAGETCGPEYGDNASWLKNIWAFFGDSMGNNGSSRYYLLRNAYVDDAEVRIFGDKAIAVYPDEPPPPPPPPPPNLVNLNFYVKDQNGQPISGASVNINQDFGNGTSRTTDGNGFANFGVKSNTDVGYSVSASSCNGVSGGANSGENGATVNAVISCSGPPPPLPPPPPGQLACSPTWQNVGVDQLASFVAGGGNGDYNWWANDGSPERGTGSNFSTRYPKKDSGKTVRLYDSAGGYAECYVRVTTEEPQPPPPPPGGCIPNGQACGGDASKCCSTYCPSIQGAPDLCQDQSQPTTPPPLPSTYQARGYVYRDLNTKNCCDGVRDSGEPGFTGEQVRLSDDSGNTIATTSTDGSGFYRFSNLSAGRYRVTHNIPSGYVRTTDDSTPFNVGPDFVHDFGLYLVDTDPVVSNVSVTEPNYCTSGPAATIGWNYSDPSGSPQSAYQVQIDDQSSFNSPEVDSGKRSCESCRSYFSGTGILRFNVTYRTRVRAWNSYDTPSSWQEATICSGDGCQSNANWKTPLHSYPNVNPPYQFIWFPKNPEPNNSVQFTDKTLFDSSSNNKQWSWTFVPAGGGSGLSTAQNPVYVFNQGGIYQVTERVRDNAMPSGQYCTSPTQAVNIGRRIPIWKEIAPR